jgi:non-heme Fe2+,alpha-ketoglutarate-dependent halogenase
MAKKEKVELFSKESLGKMDRTLRFFPSQVTDPQTVTGEQVTHYNKQGYVKGLSVFSDEQIAKYRDWFDQILQEALAKGDDAYSIFSLHLNHRIGYEIMSNPRIVAYVKDILGENVVGWGSHLFCKMAGDHKQVSWHQDAPYWPLSETKTVTVWLAIDDADAENGCMRVLPKSHLEGELDYRESDASEDNVLNLTVDDVDRFGDPVDIDLKAGQISMHNDLLLHGSEPNPSLRRRCGLTLRYCATDVHSLVSLDEWPAKGYVLSGDANGDHWHRPTPPLK